MQQFHRYECTESNIEYGIFHSAIAMLKKKCSTKCKTYYGLQVELHGLDLS